MRSPEDAPRRLPGPVAATIATAWIVGTSFGPLLLVAVLGWLTSTMVGDLDGPVRLTADVWLSGHLVPITVGNTTLTLHPLGVTVLLIALHWRAGRWIGRRASPSDLRVTSWLVGGTAAAYGALLAGVAALAASSTVRPSLPLAAIAGVAWVAVVLGPGVASGAGQIPGLRDRLPLPVLVALDAGAGAVVTLVGLASLLLGVSIVRSADSIHEITDVVAPDGPGWGVLLVINLLLLPNALAATLAYAAGPGFAIGAGTTVSIGGSELGALPPIGIIGSVPTSSTPSGAAYAVLAIPIVAGLVAGLLTIKRSSPLRPEWCALAGLGAGAVAGIAATALTWAGGGALGAGFLSTIGAEPLLVGAITAGEVGAIAAVTAWVGCPRSRRRGYLTVVAGTVLEPVTPVAIEAAPAPDPTPAEPAPIASDVAAATEVAAPTATTEVVVGEVVASNDEPSVDEPADPPAEEPVRGEDPPDDEPTVVLDRAG